MSERPSVALCIFGQLRDDHIHFPSIAQLAAALGADVFISTWRRRGTKTSGVLNRDQIMRMFGYELGAALPAPLVGETRFSEAIPAYESTLLASLGGNEVTAAQMQAHFPGAVVDIEDETMSLDFAAPVPSDRNSLRMLYKIWRCNELKRVAERKRGRRYDIVVRIRPDVLPDLTPESFAPLLAPGAPPTVLVHDGSPTATFLSDVMAISTSAVADTLAGLLSRAVQHPRRKWGFIHTELPKYLREHGIAVGPAKLKSWVTEDFQTSQPRNRRHLLALLEAGQVNTAHFPRPETWAAVRALVRAGAARHDGRNIAVVERHVAAIDLAREDADFIAGPAFLLYSGHLRVHQHAAAYAAQMVRLYCRIAVSAGACLKAADTAKEVAWLHSIGTSHGLTEPLAWRSLARHLLPGWSSAVLLHLAHAAQSAIGMPGLLEAERKLRAAVPERFPAWPGGPEGLDEAMARIAAGDLPGAREALRRLAEADPASPLPPALLADTLLAAGAHREAAQAYAAAAGLAGAGADLRAMAGEALLRAGDTAGALEAAEAALRGLPGNPFLAARVASLHAQAGRHDAAVPGWRVLVQRYPEDVAAKRALARSLAATGQPAEARELLAQAIERLPEDESLRAEMESLSSAAPPPPPPVPVERPAQAVQAPEPEPEPVLSAASISPAWQVLMGKAPPPAPAAPPPAPEPRPGLLRRLFGRRG